MKCERFLIRRWARGPALAALALAGALSASAQPAASGPPGGASVPDLPGHERAMPRKPAAPSAAVKLVDINSASRKELKTLPGIGDAEAARIVANRPYASKTELVGKEVLPMGPYLSIKSRIVALPKGRAKGGAPSASAPRQAG